MLLSWGDSKLNFGSVRYMYIALGRTDDLLCHLPSMRLLLSCRFTDFLDLVGWLATFATSMYNMYRIGTPCHHHLVIWAVAWRGQSSTADQLTLLCADRALALKYCNLYKVYNSSTDYRYHGVTMRKLVNGI